MRDETMNDPYDIMHPPECDVRWLVERLRSHTDGEAGKDCQLAADELERLAEFADGIYAWKEEGKRLMNRCGPNAAFSLGVWWADRPLVKK